MGREPRAGDAPPDLQVVLDALCDPDCRRLLGRLDEPRSARELSEACDIPLSTTYRKLDRLSEATLVDERPRGRPGSQRTTRYTLDFTAVRVVIDDDREFAVTVRRAAQTLDEELADLWSKVSRWR